MRRSGTRTRSLLATTLIVTAAELGSHAGCLISTKDYPLAETAGRGGAPIGDDAGSQSVSDTGGQPGGAAGADDDGGSGGAPTAGEDAGEAGLAGTRSEAGSGGTSASGTGGGSGGAGLAAAAGAASGGMPTTAGSGGGDSSGGQASTSAVSYVNNVEGIDEGDGVLDLVHPLIPASNRLVLVAIVSQSTNAAGINGARPTVTYGAVPMSHSGALEQSSDHDSVGFSNPYLYYYYLADADLPADGDQIVHLTTEADKSLMIAANVLEFSGVDQSSPLVPGIGLVVTNAGASCTVTGTVDVPQAGCALYTLSANSYGGKETAVIPGALTESMQLSSTSNVDSYGAFTTNASPGTSRVGFSYQWCSPAVVLPIAIARAAD